MIELCLCYSFQNFHFSPSMTEHHLIFGHETSSVLQFGFVFQLTVENSHQVQWIFQ